MTKKRPYEDQFDRFKEGAVRRIRSSRLDFLGIPFDLTYE
jgi:hypothetical protein